MEHDEPVEVGLSVDGHALWCELWMDADGGITLVRGHTCTPADAVDLCRLVTAGDAVIRDRTEDHDLTLEHPASSWLRSGS